MNPPVPPPPEPASDEDLVAFMRWLRTQPRRKTPWPNFDDPARRDLVPLEFREKLPAITLRIIMDIMKRPSPPGLSGPATRRPSYQTVGAEARPARRSRAGSAALRKPTARRGNGGGAPGDEMIQADPERPAQSWKTDGIAPMERPGAVARLFMAIVAFVERLNLKLATLGNPCVYDRAAFPWAAGVEREWRTIRDELDSRSDP